MPAPSEGPASSELTPLPQLFEEYEPTPLSEAAFAGIPDETQRRIISTLVGALKATEAGPHLSAPQLSYFLASRFGVLCDGGHFFFQGVYDAVLELQGVEEKHVYQAAVRFRRWLARIGVQFVEPGWKLDEATRARLEEQAARAPLDTYGSVAKSAAQAPAVPDVPAGPSTAEERQDRRLRAWGLRGLTTRQFALLRGGVGLLIVGVALIVRAALDPVSSLDAGSYQAVIPVTDVLLYEGKWLASLDEKRWRALDATKRGRALKDLAAILQRENRLKGARIIDAKTKGVIGYDLKGTMSLVQPVMELGLEPSRDAPAASASPAASAAPH